MPQVNNSFINVDSNTPKAGVADTSPSSKSSAPKSLSLQTPQCLRQCPLMPHKIRSKQHLQLSPRTPSLLIQDRYTASGNSSAIDRQILSILTSRVRAISLEQFAELIGDVGQNGKRAALRRIDRLEKQGWINSAVAFAHPALPLSGPVAIWKPTGRVPDFGPISYLLRTRWRLPVERTRFAVASVQAGHFYGGSGGRMPRTSELSHDLRLAGVFLQLLYTNPKRASRWISEATLYERGEGHGDKLPDAMVIGRAEKTVIECGGAYTAAKLRAFHEFCSGRGWSYEIW